MSIQTIQLYNLNFKLLSSSVAENGYQFVEIECNDGNNKYKYMVYNSYSQGFWRLCRLIPNKQQYDKGPGYTGFTFICMELQLFINNNYKRLPVINENSEQYITLLILNNLDIDNFFRYSYVEPNKSIIYSFLEKLGENPFTGEYNIQGKVDNDNWVIMVKIINDILMEFDYLTTFNLNLVDNTYQITRYNDDDNDDDLVNYIKTNGSFIDISGNTRNLNESTLYKEFIAIGLLKPIISSDIPDKLDRFEPIIWTEYNIFKLLYCINNYINSKLIYKKCVKLGNFYLNILEVDTIVFYIDYQVIETNQIYRFYGIYFSYNEKEYFTTLIIVILTDIKEIPINHFGVYKSVVNEGYISHKICDYTFQVNNFIKAIPNVVSILISKAPESKPIEYVFLGKLKNMIFPFPKHIPNVKKIISQYGRISRSISSNGGNIT
jgi:hypothetical protein